MRVLCVILARGGSTRLPGKNLALLGGIPLVAHAALRAREAACLTDTVISTDDAAIAAAVEPYGVRWIRRPDEISGQEARIEDAVAHALAVCEGRSGEHYDYVVALQAAVPIRPPGAIQALVETVQKYNARGGVTCVRRSPWVWNVADGMGQTWWNPEKGYPRSQDVRHVSLEEINSIQVTPRAEALARKRWGSPLLLLEIPRWAEGDVDDAEDLAEVGIDYDSISNRDVSPVFPWHLVTPVSVPKVSCPLDFGMGRNRLGVVFGNGPQIDALSDETLAKLRGPQFLTIGVKRIACSKRFLEASYAPDMLLQWDAPAKGAALTEAMVKGMRRMAGRTWRLGSPEANQDYYPCDQILRMDSEWSGWPGQVRMVSVVTDAACNVLYRMGVKEIYLYGVELNDARHCATEPAEDLPVVHDLKCEAKRAQFVSEWRQFRDFHPGLKIWCASKDSRLVREGVFEYREAV